MPLIFIILLFLTACDEKPNISMKKNFTTPIECMQLDS